MKTFFIKISSRPSIILMMGVFLSKKRFSKYFNPWQPYVWILEPPLETYWDLYKDPVDQIHKHVKSALKCINLFIGYFRNFIFGKPNE